MPEQLNIYDLGYDKHLIKISEYAVLPTEEGTNNSSLSTGLDGTGNTTFTPSELAKAISTDGLTPAQVISTRNPDEDLFSSNFVTGVSGYAIYGNGNVEFNDGTFRGALTASTIDIGGSDESSFHVDILGNMWLGAAAFNISDNPFAVAMNGQLRSVRGEIAGWTLSTTTFTSGLTNIVLNSLEKSISINSTTFGSDGIQLQYNAGNPRCYIGNGSTYFFSFDGTNISWGAVNTTLSTAGHLDTVSATIGGWEVVDGYIYNLQSGTPTSSPNDGIVLASGNEALIVYEDTAKRAEVGYLSSGIYGIKGYDTGGSNVLFELSDTQQVLSGWVITTGYLYGLASGTPTASPNDGIVLASGSTGSVIVYEDTAKRVELGYLSAGIYGLKGYATNGTTVIFELSDTQQKIAGWNFTDTVLRTGATDAASNVLIDSANSLMRLGPTTGNYWTLDGANLRIRSSNYVSGFAGAGCTLEPDLLEVGNIACRGLFRTYVLQKNILSVNAGSLIVAPNADVLDTDMTALDASTLTIKGTVTFAVNDRLRIKDGTDDEWFLVTNIASAPTYTVTRDQAAAYGADANPAWKKGASVVNYGQINAGGLYLTASDTNAPYMSVYTHAGSPWTTLTTQLRIGNLNGYLDYVADVYGFACGSSTGTNANITIEPTNGIRIRNGTTNVMTLDNLGNANFVGSITANAGYIGGTSGWVITTYYIKDVAGVTGLSSVVTGGDDIRIWAGHATPASAPFYVTESGALVATSATISGSITATTGAIGGWVVTATQLADVAGLVGISSAVTAGDDIRFWAGNVTPASAPFYVTEAGAMVASSATITGAITATSGAIGGFTIGASDLSVTAGGNTTIISSGATAFSAGPTGSPTVTITQAGVLTATGAIIDGYVISSKGAFGGDGSDGALSISSGTTNIDCGGAAVVVKNYTSISITGTAALTFSNPHSNGTTIFLKSQGAVTVTSSTVPAIDASGMGASASGAGQAIFYRTTAGNAGSAGEAAGAGAGGSGGSAPTPTGIYELHIAGKIIRFACGSGGGGGGNGGHGEGGGAGARGGGAVIIECGGALNITSTVNAAGAAGSNAPASTGGGGGGGGGGGAGGSFVIIYNTLTANTGTYTVTGGAGGNGADGVDEGHMDGGGGGGSGGTNRVAGGGGGTGGTGGGGALNGTGGTADSSAGGALGTLGAAAGAASGGGGGGGGAGGISYVVQNTMFA